MRINNNIPALKSLNSLSVTNSRLDRVLERLSSGKRINRAADDAAGLAIAQKMRSQVRGLDMAKRNSNDGISLIQTAEGALTEVHDMLQRMRELCVQAGNGTLAPDDRKAIDSEVTQLKNEIQRISDTTQFNGMNLLNGDVALTTTGSLTNTTNASKITIEELGATLKDGDTLTVNQTVTYPGAPGGALQSVSFSIGGQTVDFTLAELNAGTTAKEVEVNGGTFEVEVANVATLVASTGTGATTSGNDTLTISDKSLSLQIGANEGQFMDIMIGDLSPKALDIDNIDLSTSDLAQTAIENLDDAISTVSNVRSKLGAFQNRLEHTVKNLSVAGENMTASLSRIEDADMAFEMAEYTKMNVLSQAGTSMLAQANQRPQSILQLLQQ